MTTAVVTSVSIAIPAVAAASVEVAAAAYIARRDRAVNPDGRFDRRGRWTASASERQTCCLYIRTPSAAYPYSEMTHCRTAEHVARLHGVDATDVRRAARRMDASARSN